jgi:hypothetical protein
MDLWEMGMNWIEVVQYRDKWHALQNIIFNLQVPQNEGNF